MEIRSIHGLIMQSWRPKVKWAAADTMQKLARFRTTLLGQSIQQACQIKSSRQNAHAEILRRLVHGPGRSRGGTARDQVRAGIAPRQRVETRVGLEAVALSLNRGPGQRDDGVGKGDEIGRASC